MVASSAAPDALPESFDVIVVGGGPAGTTAAHLLARGGHSVLLLERNRHPRFCIGESLLPCTTSVWRDLGLESRFAEAGFVRKYGAYFTHADGQDPFYFNFGDAARARYENAYEVRRSEFDAILWEAAGEAGARCLDHARVTGFERDGSSIHGVRFQVEDGPETTVRARLVMDCSGRATLLGRELDLRRPDPRLDNVALFTHYDDVVLSNGRDAGTIGIAATDWGWMWFIPFAEGAASLGAVVDSGVFKDWKREGLDRDAIWERVLQQTPAMAGRIADSKRVRPVETTANFSYRCTEIAGDGWVLVGDAAAFLDPVFSSGVHLAMTGAQTAATAAHRVLESGRTPKRSDFGPYIRQTRSALKVFSTFIYAWYDPYFRAVFMRPPDRPGVNFLKRHIIALLGGDVFNPWLALPPLRVLMAVARIRRLVGGPLPSPEALPAPPASAP